MAISKPWVWINGQLQSLPKFQLGQTAPSAWKYNKIWGPPTNWKFKPSPKPPPTHTLITSSTQNKLNKWERIYRGMHWGPEPTATLKGEDLATHDFQDKFCPHPLKPTEGESSFWKLNPPSAKLGMLFPAHL